MKGMWEAHFDTSKGFGQHILVLSAWKDRKYCSTKCGCIAAMLAKVAGAGISEALLGAGRHWVRSGGSEWSGISRRTSIPQLRPGIACTGWACSGPQAKRYISLSSISLIPCRPALLFLSCPSLLLSLLLSLSLYIYEREETKRKTRIGRAFFWSKSALSPSFKQNFD